MAEFNFKFKCYPCPDFAPIHFRLSDFGHSTNLLIFPHVQNHPSAEASIHFRQLYQEDVPEAIPAVLQSVGDFSISFHARMNSCSAPLNPVLSFVCLIKT